MNERIYLRTRYGCVVVERVYNAEDGSVVSERALNMAELASEALRVIMAQGGVRWVDGEWECPPDLAARARWRTLMERAAAA